MAKKIVDFRKQVTLFVDDIPYSIILDRYSTVELSISLDKHRVDVYRKPRGGHPMHAIPISDYYQPKLPFDYEK